MPQVPKHLGLEWFLGCLSVWRRTSRDLILFSKDCGWAHREWASKSLRCIRWIGYMVSTQRSTAHRSEKFRTSFFKYKNHQEYLKIYLSIQVSWFGSQFRGGECRRGGRQGILSGNPEPEPTLHPWTFRAGHLGLTFVFQVKIATVYDMANPADQGTARVRQNKDRTYFQFRTRVPHKKQAIYFV